MHLSNRKHKVLGIGSKKPKSQIDFAGDVEVWDIAGTKNIFLNQEVVVRMVSLIGF